MPQEHLSGLGDVFMEAPALVCPPVLPAGDGALVQPEGRDDSLSRTAVSQQDHYGYYQLVWLVHPVEGGAFGGREGFFRTACSGSASPSGRGSRRVLLRLGRRPSNARCGKIALAGSWDTS